MLDTVGWHVEAARIDAAVRAAVDAGETTRDIGGALGTSEAGDWMAAQIRRGKV
jgi:isocitrate/isopropylmalate dehydrogenase